jgi:hypothetical protein
MILGILGLFGLLLSFTGAGVLFCIAGAILAVVSFEDSQAKHGVTHAGMICSMAGIVVLMAAFLVL